MSESRMWTYLKSFMWDHWVADRLTDRRIRGWPDVTWLHPLSGDMGLLELKYLARDPKHGRPKLGIRPEQPLILAKYYRRGGRAGVLLRVGLSDQWRFFRPPLDPSKSVEWVRVIQTDSAYDLTTHIFPRGMRDPEELLAVLRVRAL